MRVLALVCPDWPVVAASQELRLDWREPIAVLTSNRVTSCNDAARAEGVRTQMRRRAAQATCPEVTLIPAETSRDIRAFESVVSAIEALRPGAAPIRPGLLAVKSPARFYGGEENAAAVLTEAAVRTGVWDTRVGVADDVSTAVQAAYCAHAQSWTIVPRDEVTGFWQALPVEALYESAGPEEADEITEFVSLLRRLGMRTLGQFADLPRNDVAVRFGDRGNRLYRLICGEARGALDARRPPRDLTVAVPFEPPLDSVEAVSFSARQAAEWFVGQLGDQGLVCTGVSIEAETDRGTRTARTWMHASWFSASDLIDRVHWQMTAAGEARVLDGSIARLAFVPESVEGGSAYADALWGHGVDERIERGIAKVQALLGYEAVRRPALQGGRSPGERQALIPWGEQVALRSRELPWPGSIPPPAPCRVFAPPRPSSVLGERDCVVHVDECGALTRTPQRFQSHQGWEALDGWAGPWPCEDFFRFQMVSTAGRAWLLRYAHGRWSVEAGYD